MLFPKAWKKISLENLQNVLATIISDLLSDWLSVSPSDCQTVSQSVCQIVSQSVCLSVSRSVQGCAEWQVVHGAKDFFEL